jgi:hypothetical protein
MDDDTMVNWSWSGKDKNKLLYVREKGGILTVVNSKKIGMNLSLVGLKGHQFAFDTSKPAFRIKNTFFYIVDLKSGQLEFIKNKKPFSPKLWDAVMNQHIVKDLVSGLQNAQFKQMIFYLIIGICIALPLGYIIGNFVPFK